MRGKSNEMEIEDGYVETIRGGHRCKEEREVPSRVKGLVVGYGYKEWGNIGCFRNPMVVNGFILCNILCCIVE